MVVIKDVVFDYLSRFEFRCLQMALEQNERLSVQNDWFNIHTSGRGVVFNYANWTSVGLSFDRDRFLSNEYGVVCRSISEEMEKPFLGRTDYFHRREARLA